MWNNQAIIKGRDKRVPAVPVGHQVPAVQTVLTTKTDTHINKIAPWVKPSIPPVTGVADSEHNTFYPLIFINFNVYQSINYLLNLYMYLKLAFTFLHLKTQ